MSAITYSSLPDFNDELFVTRERMHYPSGSRIVEVLYGAKDAEGKAVSPDAGAEDGHGTFLAIQADGGYRLLCWKHSDAEGAAVEYGEGLSGDPLSVIEENIKKKDAVLDEARELMKGEEYDNAAVEAVLAKFAALPDHNTPKEQDLAGRCNSLIARNKADLDKKEAVKKNTEAKKALIDDDDVSYFSVLAARCILACLHSFTVFSTFCAPSSPHKSMAAISIICNLRQLKTLNFELKIVFVTKP